MIRAVALVSGGLDSILAALVIKQMGIEVRGIYFRTPFCLRKRKAGATPEELAAVLANNAGIALDIEDLGDDFLEIVRAPRHGYGANSNPCIDCKILMLSRARLFMQNSDASFLVSGEVLAQRPMSQHHPALERIAHEAGVAGLLVRPLSAKLLEPTIPEQRGWIDREKMYDFNGRSRRPQMELAVMLGVIDYPNASGGCLLTDPGFSRRLKDLLRHGPYDQNNVELLKWGRHYRFAATAKFIVGRDEAENIALEKLGQPGDWLCLPPEDVAGPTGLLRGQAGDEFLGRGCALLARYCDLKGRRELTLACRRLGASDTRACSVTPLSDEESLQFRL